MNKLILLVLAICLISVHAFVKRDAEATAPKNNWLEDVQNEFQEVFKTAREKAAETLNPDEIKKKFESIVNDFEKTINSLKAGSEKKE